MNLDDLNKAVTVAILHAEGIEPDSWEAQHAFAEIADLEQEIAMLTGADTARGQIARLGAVAASVSAGEPLRAIQIASRYRMEPLPERVLARLTELVNEAQAAIEREVVSQPQVEPIGFTLRVA